MKEPAIMNKHFACLSVFLAAAFLTGCAQPTARTAEQDPSALNNRCYTEFKALQTLDKQAFSVYKQQFSQLNDAYAVYKTNASLINKDSKEMFALELKDKQTLICARVKSAVFNNMNQRSQMLNDI